MTSRAYNGALMPGRTLPGANFSNGEQNSFVEILSGSISSRPAGAQSRNDDSRGLPRNHFSTDETRRVRHVSSSTRPTDFSHIVRDDKNLGGEGGRDLFEYRETGAMLSRPWRTSQAIRALRCFDRNRNREEPAVKITIEPPRIPAIPDGRRAVPFTIATK